VTIIDTVFATQSRSHALLLSTLASVGLIVGAVWAERAAAELRRYDLLMPGVSGVLFALVAVTIMPFAELTVGRWLIPFLYLAGAAASVILCTAARHLALRRAKTSNRSAKQSGRQSAFAERSVFAIVDLLGYGMAIGVAAAASATLGIALATGLTAANVLVSRQLTAGFLSAKMGRMDRVVLQVGLVLVLNVFALLAFWTVHSFGSNGLPGLVAFFGGFLLAAAARTLLSHGQGIAAGKQVGSALAFLCGFVAFALFAVGLGEILDAAGISSAGLEHPVEQSSAQPNTRQARG
jgi:zinc transporter ZupT